MMKRARRLAVALLPELVNRACRVMLEAAEDWPVRAYFLRVGGWAWLSACIRPPFTIGFLGSDFFLGLLLLNGMLGVSIGLFLLNGLSNVLLGYGLDGLRFGRWRGRGRLGVCCGIERVYLGLASWTRGHAAL
jgi:hypothetical protein